MNIQNFIKRFSAQFENTDAGAFKTDTEFRVLDEWSSMIALSIIAMIDEEYNVKLKGNDIRNSKTIQDLYDIVQSRIQADL
jgi:acyl carrier protein